MKAAILALFSLLLALPAAASAENLPRVSVEDSLGKGTVILSLERETRKDNDGNVFASGTLSAVRKQADGEILWTIRDYENECIASLETGFLMTPQVTDLDGNGKVEIWVAYKCGCRGGVDPVSTKIIMYEGQLKYAMRGESRIQMGNEIMGGKYTFDGGFLYGPEVFKTYGDKLWKKVSDERNWGKNGIKDDANLGDKR